MKLFQQESIDVVCAVIFNKEASKVLVGKRNDVKQWEFPGGKVEHEETYEQAIRREIREELNSEIELLAYHGCDLKEKTDKTINLYVFLARFKSGEPQLVEHDEIKWITKDEIDQMEWIESDQLLQEVKDLMRG